MEEPEPLTEPLGAGFWNARYQAGETGWDLGEPSPPFLALHRQRVIGPCRVAVPGCGRGLEVAWLAQHGYQVTGIDFAPEAIEASRGLLAAAGLCATLECADLFALPETLEGVFDLILEQTCFCAIDPARRADYVESVARLLAPGGRLVGLFYACKGDNGPPFRTGPEEVRRLFSGAFEIKSLALTHHSHPRRMGEEWLGVLRRR